MRPIEDLTIKARIRDAALEHFAEHGVKGATLRAIAERAGTSLGVVQYHFGSKEGLRDACDAHVVAFIKQEIEQAVDGGKLEDPAFIAEAMQAAPPILRYLGRALVDGSPATATLFDELVALTEEYLGDRPDARGLAAVLTTMRLGVYVLHEHLSRALGADAFSPGSLARIGAAQLAIISSELAGADLTGKARAGLERLAVEESDRD